MIIFTKAHEQDWFKKPEMMGHVWAKEKIENIEKLITSSNKKNALKIIPVSETKYNWNDFDFLTTDYITRTKRLLLLLESQPKNLEQTFKKLYQCYTKSRYFIDATTLVASKMVKVLQIKNENISLQKILDMMDLKFNV